jgi:hypothetical protein
MPRHVAHTALLHARTHLHWPFLTVVNILTQLLFLLRTTCTSCASAVNLPGYFYTPGNASTAAAPTATLCQPDTWSRGLRKQRACVNCAQGYTTRGVNGSTSSDACSKCFFQAVRGACCTASDC